MQLALVRGATLGVLMFLEAWLGNDETTSAPTVAVDISVGTVPPESSIPDPWADALNLEGPGG